ncbi:cytoplasmic dynein 2 intermediate chain 1 isoform X2 [Nerophis lumbriciformis]|uniref:cytoplasmic dynein 2 intermediate chain 1 isoform X2 n=1 Tax=Nerophis lumbriciformis TaxID=546530 RepID=UPI002ADFF853|nr:cytoplasmic dynein 2 intermediate chain 1-like isoform X2 [Nerophis lumbriciformis]
MHNDKKLSMEDTWPEAALTRHMSRRLDEHGKKRREGDSAERRRRDMDRESVDGRDGKKGERRRERDRRGHESREDRDQMKDKEEDRHRREEKERRREERDRERRTERDKRSQEDREGDRDRERRSERDRRTHQDREGDRDPELRREDRDRDRRTERDRRTHKDREGDRHSERRREDRDRERRTERDRRTHKDREGDRDSELRREDRDRDRRTERDRRTHQDREGERNSERIRDDRDEERRTERDRRAHQDREGDQDPEPRREERGREHRTERDRRTHQDREGDRDSELRREDRDGERRTERDRRTHEERKGDRDSERRREDRDKERRTERDRRTHKDRERDRDSERRREDRDRERKTERDRRTQEDREGDRDSELRREDRDRERRTEREEREQHRKNKEERETRHKDRRHHDEKPRLVTEEGADEERAESNRRKERTRGEDPQRHHRDGQKEQESHSQESRSGKKAEEDTKHAGDVAAKEAGDAEQPVAIDVSSHQYEDDFEDYEEDFEELDDNEGEGEEEAEEVKAIQLAMGEENQRVRASLSTLSREEDEEEKMPQVKGYAQTPSKSSQRGKFMDFAAAKQREVIKKVSSRQKKRSADLLRLIDLDLSTTVSLLDLPPVSEYDMYIRSFGAANTKQAYVQCNEDNVDRDVQTEETYLSDKWTQHPAEHCGVCGDPNGTHDTRDLSGMNLDSRRLAAFLRSASQVMAVLLEEDHAQKSSFKERTTQTDTLSFSDGSVQLNTELPFLLGRAVSLLNFSTVQRHTLLSVHQPAASVAPLGECSIICIWRMWEPSRPQKILLFESEVTCCSFSPGKSTLVFAGTSIGSVALWDLREPDGDHERLRIDEEEWTFRRPTFSTDALSSAHFSPVTAVEVLPANVLGGPGSEVPFLASEEELLGLSFQLASLDERGLLNLWVVLQLPKANEAGCQTDLGLRPGGKVKLLHSSCVATEGVWPSLAEKSGPLQTLALKFLPTDCSHFFIGTSMGLVSHGTTQGLKAPPKFYSSQEFGARLVDVSSIHFSPFRPGLFLVGCGDGSVRLHRVSCDKPVAEWSDSTAGEAVVSLQWSQTRPAVFCVLDAASILHVWDLLKKDSGPVVSEHMDRLTAMTAFGDPGQQNTYSGIATAQQSGKIEMHYFTQNFSLQSSEEEQTLERISQSL